MPYPVRALWKSTSAIMPASIPCCFASIPFASSTCGTTTSQVSALSQAKHRSSEAQIPSINGCAFVPGDGIGGSDSWVGDAPNAQACAAMVQAQQPTANGATYSNDGGTACYAEFGMTGSNDSSGWQSCMW